MNNSYTIRDENVEKVAQLGNLLGLVVPRNISPAEESILIKDGQSFGEPFVRLLRRCAWDVIQDITVAFEEELKDSAVPYVIEWLHSR